ncbi:universal stress protein [Microbispora sp. RL4-1S]|uniref:Universal stress protein n=1 Tax=Microbispora oryzae TaxID=2806554 RepID=A0A940WH52_9ACTN|nr:universal stress protein [Microbispora oryzae]MBP2703922.1 universal stress protein [Microbispora oryzae]
MSAPVVVGTDGSACAAEAVAWAADDAARRGAPLRVVHVVDRLPYDVPSYPIPDMYDRMVRSGGQILSDAERAARAVRPEIDVTAELVEGHPVGALREQAAEAVELVVGSRGLGGFSGMLLGSVSARVAGSVPVPVVVVRPVPTEARAEIAVGYDGSPGAETAMAYAVEEARLRECAVRAVYAWELPPQVYAPPGIAFDPDEVRRAQRDYAMGRLAGWCERHGGDLKIELDTPAAHPVIGLCDASRRSRLLVVGSRGRGGVASALLGSVGRAVLHHAHCPVAVVR